MLRRLHNEQPASFAFTPANQQWAEAQLTKFPEGRQASGIIPLLWRAQEQEGWLTRPAIEYVATMLGMDYIRALEVATFYFMFQLQPVGSIAHFQICGTTSCMICGAEDLLAVCKEEIAEHPYQISENGLFSWEEVECLGACTNAPMMQVGKDYYEDLTAEKFRELLKELAAGNVPKPGPQNGRFAAEPLGGPTSLMGLSGEKANGSVARALELGDTIKRIDGSEVPLLTPWLNASGKATKKPAAAPKAKTAKVEAPVEAKPVEAEKRPEALSAARDGKGDDLKKIKGVGPKMEKMLNEMGFYHFDQIAAWTPAEVAWVDDHLQGFKGRVSRDNWVEQAEILGAGGDTAFSKKVDKGGVY